MSRTGLVDVSMCLLCFYDPMWQKFLHRTRPQDTTEDRTSASNLKTLIDTIVFNGNFSFLRNLFVKFYNERPLNPQLHWRSPILLPIYIIAIPFSFPAEQYMTLTSPDHHP